MTDAAKYDSGKHNSGISLELTTVFYCNFPKFLPSPESDNISDIEIGIQCIAGDWIDCSPVHTCAHLLLSVRTMHCKCANVYLNILGNSEMGILECWSNRKTSSDIAWELAVIFLVWHLPNLNALNCAAGAHTHPSSHIAQISSHTGSLSKYQRVKMRRPSFLQKTFLQFRL